MKSSSHLPLDNTARRKRSTRQLGSFLVTLSSQCNAWRNIDILMTIPLLIKNSVHAVSIPSCIPLVLSVLHPLKFGSLSAKYKQFLTKEFRGIE